MFFIAFSFTTVNHNHTINQLTALHTYHTVNAVLPPFHQLIVNCIIKNNTVKFSHCFLSHTQLGYGHLCHANSIILDSQLIFHLTFENAFCLLIGDLLRLCLPDLGARQRGSTGQVLKSLLQSSCICCMVISALQPPP